MKRLTETADVTRPSRTERLARLRRRVDDARAVLLEAQTDVLWIRTGPDLDDEEPTPIQQKIWTTCAALEDAIAFALPEGDAWYHGAECAEFTRVLEALERLAEGHPS